VTLNSLSREDFFRVADTAAFFTMAVVSSSGDATDILDEEFHTRTKAYGLTNRARYSNREVDRLIERSDSCFAQQRRLEMIQEVMGIIMRDMPQIPMLVEDEVCGVSDRIEWTPRLDMMILGKEVRKK
jgi:ABC-type transport system substrate-binding protein